MVPNVRDRRVIISHKHKFIFLHTPKAAGSSLAVALMRHVGALDLCIGQIHEAAEQGVKPNARSIASAFRPDSAYLIAKLYAASLWSGRSRPAFTFALDYSIRRRWRKHFGFQSPHAKAADIRRRFPREWDSYFKFCVIRNPWDRAVSEFFWQTRNEPQRPTFDEYLRSSLGVSENLRWRKFIPDTSSIYRIEGQLAVDAVIRYENLQSDFDAVLRRFDLPQSELPRVKGDTRQKADLKAIYCQETAELVRRENAADIEEFGYSF